MLVGTKLSDVWSTEIDNTFELDSIKRGVGESWPLAPVKWIVPSGPVLVGMTGPATAPVAPPVAGGQKGGGGGGQKSVGGGGGQNSGGGGGGHLGAGGGGGG